MLLKIFVCRRGYGSDSGCRSYGTYYINFEIAREAGKIAVIETILQCRDVAQRFDPDLIFDPEKDDIVHKVKEFN